MKRRKGEFYREWRVRGISEKAEEMLLSTPILKLLGACLKKIKTEVRGLFPGIQFDSENLIF
jgi:hypothetical protein